MELLERFTKAERVLHWTNALAIFFLGLTGVAIWRDLDKIKINGVNVIAQSHVYLGGGLLVLGALGFLIFRKRQVAQADKRFSPAQRVNLLLTKVLLFALLASGAVINFGKAMGLTKEVRHQIKDLHGLGAALVGLIVLAHLAMIAKNRGIISGMITGKAAPDVIAKVSPKWVESLKVKEPVT